MKQIPSFFNAKVGELAQRDRKRAFNLLELLVVLLLIGLMAAMTLSALGRTLPRYKLRGKATEVSGFFQKARLAAIKSGLDVSIEIETMGNSEQALFAYRNNTNGTKTELYRLMVGSPVRPFDPYLGGVPVGGSTDAAKALTFVDGFVVYKATGNAAKTGAFRISIGVNKSINTIEVAIPSLGGQPVLRKYIVPSDRPTSLFAQEFFKETHYGTDWEWIWY